MYLTYTLVILHLIARWADTSEGSIQILTSARRAGAGQTHAFIDICGEWDHVETCVSICACQKKKTVLHQNLEVIHSFMRRTATVLPIRSVLVTLEAEALEGTLSVDTMSVPAHLALENAALVYVCEVNSEDIDTAERPSCFIV